MYRFSVLSVATSEQLRILLQRIVSIPPSVASGKLAYLAVWALAVQRIERPQLVEESGPAVVEALVSAMRFGNEVGEAKVDALMKDVFGALGKVFKRLPRLSIITARAWFGPAFSQMLSDDPELVKLANGFFPSVVEQFIVLHDDHVNDIKALYNATIAETILLLQARKEHTNLLTAWGHLVAMLGSSVHKTQSLNVLLKIVEVGFNSGSTDIRSQSHQAWRRLILNFCHDGMQKDEVSQGPRSKGH
ncbi:DNA-binding protein rif1 [Thoreauomyces humboldtii]|nr:DNA-binding protein rif1 [Thoreauomyces humboldtii]